MRKNKIKIGYYFLALICYCLLIFVLSSLPGESLPEVDFELSDKFVHVIEYGVLCLLFFYSLKNQSKYVKLKKFAPEYSVLFTALYGLTDEVHQYFVPGRSCEVYDWFADVAGALLIYIFIKMFNNKRKTVAAIILMLIAAGCSSSENLKSGDNYKITITSEEAWLNLMPVVGERENNFGFAINVNMENYSDEKGVSIMDLVVYLNNDTLTNKNFETEVTKSGKDVNIKIFQLNSESYLDKSKPLPEEAQFTFRIYKGSSQIKKLKTSKLNINKVY